MSNPSPTPIVTPATAASFLARFTGHPAQAAFVACRERFSFYVGGVGAGKTTAGAVRAIAWALSQPGSLGVVGAPTYPMLRDATERTVFEWLDGELGDDPRADEPGVVGEAPQLNSRVGEAPQLNCGGKLDGDAIAAGTGLPREFNARDGRPAPNMPLASSPGPLIPYKFNKTERHLRLENGSEILFRSLDEPDRLRGLTIAWFWLDEAPLCGYGAWQQMKARLRQPGFDLAGWATGTPHGRDGFYRDFELRPREHHALFRAATTENAAHLPPDYVADLGLSGALYDQEVLGLFTAFEGLVYSFQADATGGHMRAPDADRRFARVIGGIDWGYTNPTAAVVFGLDGDDRAWQLAELYLPRASLHETVYPALLELTARWGVGVWYAGPDEPEHIAGLRLALERVGSEQGPAAPLVPVIAADDAVVAGIQTVTRHLARRADGTRGLYVDPSCRWTIAEYASYQYPPATLAEGLRDSEGQGLSQAGPLSELPLKANDHLMDATRYALHTHFAQVRAAQRTDGWLVRWLPERTVPARRQMQFAGSSLRANRGGEGNPSH